MRTLLTALALALVLVASQASAAAGPTVFGVKAGLSFANLGGDDNFLGDDAPNSDSRTAGCLGGFVEIPINNMISFQPEMLYAMKGAKWSEGDVEATLKLSYIEVPMLFKVNIPMQGQARPFLAVGPAVAFKTSAKGELTYEDATIELDVDDVKGTDLGMIIGGGVGFPFMNRMAMLEARYDLGLTTIDDSEDACDIKNRAISILVGFTF